MGVSFFLVGEKNQEDSSVKELFQRMGTLIT